ncbi:hypothetical protein [Acrocarpospora corrugata]|uniref:hypothetical protein n=1 Tax=Acrocarpospora corrugata TaxID=35763 RepID=UPI0012D2BE8C|nr:hypothetical protein [Acrocarpospora corrugata]
MNEVIGCDITALAQTLPPPVLHELLTRFREMRAEQAIERDEPRREITDVTFGRGARNPDRPSSTGDLEGNLFPEHSCYSVHVQPGPDGRTDALVGLPRFSNRAAQMIVCPDIIWPYDRKRCRPARRRR